MDWARAKNIILILLIVFNVFLLSRILINADNQGASRETILNTEKILESRKIILKCNIPRYDSDTPKLVFGSGGLDDKYREALIEGLAGKGYMKKEMANSETIYENAVRKLTFTGRYDFTYTDENPSEKVDIVHISETEKYAEKFLKKYGLKNAIYITDEKPMKQGTEVVFSYIEKYGAFPVFDNYLKLKVSDKGVTYLEVRHREIKYLSQDKIRNILAAYQILLDKFKGDERAVITAIDIGYKMPEDSLQNQIQLSEQIPVWRVKLEGSETPVYYDASNGNQIK